MIIVLVALNTVGVQEAAKLSITLAVIDFATQALLVLLGFFLVLSPEILVDNIHRGVAPTWGNLAIAIPVAMSAHRCRDGLQPRRGGASRSGLSLERVQARRRRGVRDLPHAPARRALRASGAGDRRRADDALALPPEDGGYANDPILGVVENLGIEERYWTSLQIYVGVLAATILFIATNAGVIGASRITYSMATYRQMPRCSGGSIRVSRRPTLALILFAGIALIVIPLPGDVNFVGTPYSRSARRFLFTVAHAALVRLRMDPDPAAAYEPDRTSDSEGSTGRCSRCSGGCDRDLVRRSSSRTC